MTTDNSDRKASDRKASDENAPDRKGIDNRLVLAFDASCGTCRRIAERTAGICGDRVRVLGLAHPEVARLRHEALGPAAPWAPTLLDPRASPPRAWLGAGLAVRLATAIGPRRSWRVLKAIGAVRREGLPSGTGAPTISRARFLGGVPLAVGGATLFLAGPARAAGPGPALRLTATPSHATSTRQLTGTTLFDTALRTLDRPDVQNVLDRALAVQLRAGTRVDEPAYRNDTGLIRYADAGTTRLAADSVVVGACALIRTGEHAIGTNTATVTAYVLPNEGYALAHEQFAREFDGVRSRARLWRTPTAPDGEFALAAVSVNGSVPELLAPDTATTVAAAAQRCGGCTLGGDWSEERILGTECGGGRFYDCAKAAAPCAACATQCGTFGPICIGCLVSLCPFAYVDCCGGRVPVCYSCDVQ